MPGKKLGIGVLGAAAIARKNVKAIGKSTNGVVVVAIGSRTLSKAEAFIQDTGLEGTAKAYGSYDALLDAPEVDAVYMPLPTATHLEWVKRAAAKKKHVLLEKPIALTVEETDAIVKVCKDAGVQLMDGTMFVHQPRSGQIFNTISDSKKMGLLRSITSTFYFSANGSCAKRNLHIHMERFGLATKGEIVYRLPSADEYFFANDVRTRKDGDALGCYGDIGWYCIRAALWAFQYEKPVLVQAHPAPTLNANGVVMHGGGTIIWEGGRRLTFDCGFDTVHSMYLQISGTQGMVELTDFCIPYRPEKCSFTVKGPAVWHDNDTWIEQQIEIKEVTMDRPQETFMWEHFAECIYKIQDGHEPDSSWPAQAALCNKLCVAVDKSAQQGGRPVDVRNWF